jgi:hypothetical protein
MKNVNYSEWRDLLQVSLHLCFVGDQENTLERSPLSTSLISLFKTSNKDKFSLLFGEVQILLLKGIIKLSSTPDCHSRIFLIPNKTQVEGDL